MRPLLLPQSGSGSMIDPGTRCARHDTARTEVAAMTEVPGSSAGDVTAPTPGDPPYFTVRARDGVRLAVWPEGRGPGLVLVHGSFQDHSASAALVRELRGDFTTYAVDRRGFGASGDGAPYSLDREFDDVAAVVDEVAVRTGRPVVLWGHSFGANCALGAAARTGNVGHLVLYEPSLGLPYPPGWIDRLEAVVADGGHEEAITMALRDVLGLTDAQVEATRAGPRWAELVTTAPTIAREARAEQEWAYPDSRLDGVTAPALLLSGSDSTPDLRRATAAARAAVPGARVHLLQGHAHAAHRTHPADVARVLRTFVSTHPAPNSGG